MHTEQAVWLLWGEILSSSISVSKGVKLGGILSPLLSSIYADMLLTELRNCGQGCYIGRTVAGVFAYADDIILLAPSRTGLLNMLEIAEQIGKDLNIKFNPAKCQFLKFMYPTSVSNDNVEQLILFCDMMVPLSESAVHLGRYIGINYRVNSIQKSVNELYQRCNSLLSNC
ncbi:uncharacterized protein LOC106459806 [Limulus polyphemus]|uniref:Uncharacterized protein LOC106459806 n=1 Tax=Limulus polyphemus TaxID=6850 RepID=A0ABM1B4Y7_LIMPO|nr:uncharacterized protein LOC106459806 [Limulus polyphemus]